MTPTELEAVKRAESVLRDFYKSFDHQEGKLTDALEVALSLLRPIAEGKSVVVPVEEAPIKIVIKCATCGDTGLTKSMPGTTLSTIIPCPDCSPVRRAMLTAAQGETGP